MHTRNKEIQEFGRLTFLNKKNNVKGKSRNYKFGFFLCKCGNFCWKNICSVKSGHTSSCGCYLKERIIETHTKHGLSHTKTYRNWQAMHDRCKNKSNIGFSNYGGRGIKVCERWNSFEKFYEDMGRRPPKKSIDRINNIGDYEPSNCRWATSTEQNNNSRRNRFIDFNGKRMTITNWAKKLGINQSTFYMRVKNKWPIARIFNEPVNK